MPTGGNLHQLSSQFDRHRPKATLIYEVTAFPSLHGTPWRTNYLWLAMLYAYWRATWSAEARIVHTPSGRHVKVL